MQKHIKEIATLERENITFALFNHYFLAPLPHLNAVIKTTYYFLL